MDQIPRGCELLTPAVDALLGDLVGDRRAARERYAQSGPTGGRFGDILRGWRGQAEVIRARLTKEVMATRLDRCDGQDLKDLAKSEYFAELPSDPQFAIGEAVFTREVVTASATSTANFRAGVIPAGTKLKRAGDPLYFVPLLDAEYEMIEPLVCGQDDTSTSGPSLEGDWFHLQTFTVKIKATREGPHANTPVFTIAETVSLSFVGKVFDPLFGIASLNASGGSLGVIDDQIRALARAMATGSNGPTGQALVAGALTNPGVRRVAYAEDPVNAVGLLFVADESWASAVTYRAELLQALRERPWIGWGCKVELRSINNIGITVSPTILLRSPDFVSAETEITESIKTALLEYFDERPDFYTWTLNAIGAVIGGADDRILACTGVTVLNRNNFLIAAVDSLGVISGEEPPATIAGYAGSNIVHFALIGSAVTPTYTTPGQFDV